MSEHVRYVGGRLLDLDEYRDYLDRFGDEDICQPCNVGSHRACRGSECACCGVVGEEEEDV